MMYILNTPKELITQLAKRVEEERLSQKLSQKELSCKADIPLSTYKAFLHHQKLSIENLFKLLFVLQMQENIEGLLSSRSHRSLADLKENTLPKRIRK